MVSTSATTDPGGARRFGRVRHGNVVERSVPANGHQNDKPRVAIRRSRSRSTSNVATCLRIPGFDHHNVADVSRAASANRPMGRGRNLVEILAAVFLSLVIVACKPPMDDPVIGGVYVLEELALIKAAARASWPIKALRIDHIDDGVLLAKYVSGRGRFDDAEFRYGDECGCFELTEERTFAPDYDYTGIVYIKPGAKDELAVWWIVGGEREGPFRYVMTYVDDVDQPMNRRDHDGEDWFGLFARRDGAKYPMGVPPASFAPGTTFRDRLRSGVMGPEMVVIPAGRFHMGALSFRRLSGDRERPVREVVIEHPFALSVYELTFEHYDLFTHPEEVEDSGWGRGRRPVINVSWQDARNYVEWLSSETGEDYGLPTEAEWEYAARAGTTTVFSWGDGIGKDRANCKFCGSGWDSQTAPVGWYAPNAFGLYDVHGNVSEWVQDCWNWGYAGAPSNGAGRLGGDCEVRVLRGGSWFRDPWSVYSAARDRASPVGGSSDVGLRVARTLVSDPGRQAPP